MAAILEGVALASEVAEMMLGTEAVTAFAGSAQNMAALVGPTIPSTIQGAVEFVTSSQRVKNAYSGLKQLKNAVDMGQDLYKVVKKGDEILEGSFNKVYRGKDRKIKLPPEYKRHFHVRSNKNFAGKILGTPEIGRRPQRKVLSTQVNKPHGLGSHAQVGKDKSVNDIGVEQTSKGELVSKVPLPWGGLPAGADVKHFIGSAHIGGSPQLQDFPGSNYNGWGQSALL